MDDFFSKINTRTILSAVSQISIQLQSILQLIRIPAVYFSIGKFEKKLDWMISFRKDIYTILSVLFLKFPPNFNQYCN